MKHATRQLQSGKRVQDFKMKKYVCKLEISTAVCDALHRQGRSQEKSLHPALRKGLQILRRRSYNHGSRLEMIRYLIFLWISVFLIMFTKRLSRNGELFWDVRLL